MILKMALTVVVSTLLLLQTTNGASFSKVFVERGRDVVPVEYINYGAPAAYTDSQIAELSAAPIGSVLPYPSLSNVVSPCVSPCVVPSQNIAPVAPLTNAKIITYNPPNVPVVVAPNQDASYEYSYVVYDENTGDRKAQRESSDGAVVRGEYSFIQPDGYIREVKYTADDLTGFNVVVKNVLPESIQFVEKKTKSTEKNEPIPCVNTQSEALKLEIVHTENDGHDHGHNISELAEVPAQGEPHTIVHFENDGHDHRHKIVKPVKVPAQGEPPKTVHFENDGHDHRHKIVDLVEVPAQEKPRKALHFENDGHDHGHKIVELVEVPAQEEPHKVIIKVHKPEPKSQEHEHLVAPEQHEEHEHKAEPETLVKPKQQEPAPHEVPEHHEKPAQHNEPVGHKELEPHKEPDHNHEENKPVHEVVHEVMHLVPELPAPAFPVSEAVVSFDDIIRCVQARIQSQHGTLLSDVSPLTYIILPGGRPC